MTLWIGLVLTQPELGPGAKVLSGKVLGTHSAQSEDWPLLITIGSICLYPKCMSHKQTDR